jgi:hypothetical protein
MTERRKIWISKLVFVACVLAVPLITANSYLKEKKTIASIADYVADVYRDGGRDAVNALCKMPVSKIPAIEIDDSYTCLPLNELVYKAALDTRLGYTMERQDIVDVYYHGSHFRIYLNGKLKSPVG